MDSDIVSIYEKLRKRYPIILKSSLEVSPKFTMDFPVLQGHSILGSFELLYDGVSFPFYFKREDGSVYAHWHLQTPDEAEKTVVDFMEGKPCTT